MSPKGNEQYCGASCTNRALAVRISAWILNFNTNCWAKLWLSVSFLAIQPYNPYFPEAEWKTVGFSPSGLFFCDSTCCIFWSEKISVPKLSGHSRLSEYLSFPTQVAARQTLLWFVARRHISWWDAQNAAQQCLEQNNNPLPPGG